MLAQITPLILTYNEAPNIERNLHQLHWANDLVLVDSFSSDGTVELALRFPRVRVFQRSFDSHQQQWNFGIQETQIRTAWILALDADYILTEEFVAELQALQPDADVSAYIARFIYCVEGKRLRSGIYPPVTVLYRRDAAHYEQDGHTQRLSVKGKVKTLSTALLHDDRKSITRWLYSQARYSELESRKLRNSSREELSFTDRLRRWYVIAPVAVMFYCLFFRGGVVDGWAGLHYAIERAIAESMLSLHLIREQITSRTLNTQLPASNTRNSAHFAGRPDLQGLSIEQ